MKRYVYFCSYNIARKNGIGFGRCEINCKQPITNFDDIEEMEKIIKIANKTENALIINYQLLREEHENV